MPKPTWLRRSRCKKSKSNCSGYSTKRGRVVKPENLQRSPNLPSANHTRCRVGSSMKYMRDPGGASGDLAGAYEKKTGTPNPTP